MKRKKPKRVCGECSAKRKALARSGRKTRIGRPCPECGALCGCDWHAASVTRRTR